MQIDWVLEFPCWNQAKRKVKIKGRRGQGCGKGKPVVKLLEALEACKIARCGRQRRAVLQWRASAAEEEECTAVCGRRRRARVPVVWTDGLLVARGDGE